jgi:hypothetical protein
MAYSLQCRARDLRAPSNLDFRKAKFGFRKSHVLGNPGASADAWYRSFCNERWPDHETLFTLSSRPVSHKGGSSTKACVIISGAFIPSMSHPSTRLNAAFT